MAWPDEPRGEHPADPESELTWPVRIEVIPGKLSVRVYRHDIAAVTGSIPCWSYVTQGLTALQQTEIVFTLRRDPDEPSDGFPDDPLRLFAAILPLTEAGQRVTSGSFTELGGGGFFGHHLLYVRAQALNGVSLPASCLAALLVTGDELRAVREFGSTRVLARLGQATSHYPFPPWGDRHRPGMSLTRTLEASLLSKIPRASAHDVHVGVAGGQITVSVLRSEQSSWQDRLAQVPDTMPLALLTALDPAADGCLTWVPGQTGPEAIVPPGSDGSRVCGCFIAFVPGQPANGGKLLEDGLAMELTSEAWSALRRALIDGQELAIPASDDLMPLALSWRDEVYVSPIDARAYRAEGGWETHQPEAAASAEAAGGAGATEKLTGEIRLLTSENEILARTSGEALVAFFQQIKACADRLLGDQGDQAEIVLRLRCTAQGHTVDLSGRGEVPPEVMQALFETIKALPPLPVREGEVSFEMQLLVSR
jgi:hypothetical protein